MYGDKRTAGEKWREPGHCTTGNARSLHSLMGPVLTAGCMVINEQQVKNGGSLVIVLLLLVMPEVCVYWDKL